MTQTTNYQLNQWEATDQVQRVDFNADNAKIDAALAAKAEQSALAALTQTVNGKAAQSALTALQTAVNGKGNCKIAFGSYTGSGTYGSTAPNSLTFPFKPLLVVISNGSGFAAMISGEGTGKLLAGPIFAMWALTWSGNSVSWYASQASYANFSSYQVTDETQMNRSGTVYRYVALGAADA